MHEIKDMFIYTKGLLKKSPLWLHITLPLFLLLAGWGVLFAQSLISAKNAYPLWVELEGLSPAELESFSVHKITPNRNVHAIEKSDGVWSVDKKYVKGLKLELTEDLLESDFVVKIYIAKGVMEFSRERLLAEWRVERAGGRAAIYSPEELVKGRSVFSVLFAKLDNILNYPYEQERTLAFKALIKAIIAVLFIPLAIAIFLLLSLFMEKGLGKMRVKLDYRLSFLLFALLVSFALFNSAGVADVDNVWIDGWWVDSYRAHGFIGGYKDFGDNYPPLSFIYVGLVVEISELFNISNFVVYKLGLFIFLLASSLTFLYFTRDKLLTAILHLALAVATMGHGYMDILFVPFLIAALYMIKRDSYLGFTIFYSLSVLMKWQPLIFLPFILVYLLKFRRLEDLGELFKKRFLSQVLLPGSLIVAAMIVIFGPFFIVSLIKGMGHDGLSYLALNFNWIYTFFLKLIGPERYGALGSELAVLITGDLLSRLPKLVFTFIYFFTLYQFIKVKDKRFPELLLYLALGYLTYFMFNIGVHQNHLVPLVPIMVMLWQLESKYREQAIFWLFYCNINLIIFLGLDGRTAFNRVIWGFDFITLLISAVGLFAYIKLFINRVPALKGR